MLISALATAAPYRWMHLANLLPWTAAVIDAGENIVILTMLATYPTNVAGLAPYAAVLTSCKWQLVAVSVFAVLVLAACCVINMLQCWTGRRGTAAQGSGAAAGSSTRKKKE
jgi:hypothetical protein